MNTFLKHGIILFCSRWLCTTQNFNNFQKHIAHKLSFMKFIPPLEIKTFYKLLKPRAVLFNAINILQYLGGLSTRI